VVRVTRFAFFDLDNTLVDQTAALMAWARDFVADRGLDPAAVDWFEVKNHTAPTWRAYAGQIKKQFGLSDSVDGLIHEVTETYPSYFVLEDSVAEGLRLLRAKEWKLAVITNGTTAVQMAKVNRVDLWSLVDGVFVSESVGVRKPDPHIFEIAADKLDVELGCDGWMVGDNLDVDIAGGTAAGLRTIWLPHGHPQPEEGPWADRVCETVDEAIDLLAAI
jgi:HAD superfamily hydrolase (TIGR01549 family)